MQQATQGLFVCWLQGPWAAPPVVLLLLLLLLLENTLLNGWSVESSRLLVWARLLCTLWLHAAAVQWRLASCCAEFDWLLAAVLHVTGCQRLAASSFATCDWLQLITAVLYVAGCACL